MMNILQKLFSIKNDNRFHKIITICGIKFKIVDKTKRTIFKLKSDFASKLQQVEDLSMKRVRKTTSAASIDIIEVHIVEHCNLNCKGCLHFSPLAREEYLDIKEYKRDLLRLHELTNGNVSTFNILGGEPLLHPQCLEFLKATREIFPKSIVKLVTNGILLPEQPDLFFKSCSEYNITIESTKYPLDIDWEKIKNKALRHNVKFKFYNGDSIKVMEFLPIDTDGKQDNRLSFLNCQLGWPTILWLDHGNLYQCERVAYIKHFNRFFGLNLKVEEDAYLNIYKISNIKEILDFQSRPTSFCRYCKKIYNKSLYQWSQSERLITEWVEETPETLVAAERERERE